MATWATPRWSARSRRALSIRPITSSRRFWAASRSETSSIRLCFEPEPPRSTKRVRTSPALVMMVTLASDLSKPCFQAARAASRSSAMTVDASSASTPSGAVTTSEAGTTPATLGKVTALLPGLAATTISTRPKSSRSTLARAEMAESMSSASTASESEPSPAAIAASKPALTWMCSATRPRIPESLAFTRADEPSF